MSGGDGDGVLGVDGVSRGDDDGSDGVGSDISGGGHGDSEGSEDGSVCDGSDGDG